MSDDDYEIHDDVNCPKCGHHTVHSRRCSSIFCEEGYNDEHEYDPINFRPGESMNRCEECKGTGHEWWCPSCGANLSGEKLEFPNEDEYEL
jgi:predicted RNA-binding Zn-ribbon protein involved in translation (DUF1610 family)